jgi:hypothetical protein
MRLPAFGAAVEIKQLSAAVASCLQVPCVPPNAAASLAGALKAPAGTWLPSDACAGHRRTADICTVPRCSSGAVSELRHCLGLGFCPTLPGGVQVFCNLVCICSCCVPSAQLAQYVAAALYSSSSTLHTLPLHNFC